eukprot:scaffold28968_cov120-Isochrysis_galbana.AAC.8
MIWWRCFEACVMCDSHVDDAEMRVAPTCHLCLCGCGMWRAHKAGPAALTLPLGRRDRACRLRRTQDI